MTLRLAASIIPAIFLILSGAAAAQPPCTLEIYASIDIGTDEYGGIYIPFGINGVSKNLLVDTGGIYSMLRGRVADELRLKRKPIGAQNVFREYGGQRITQFVTTDSVALGAFKGAKMYFLVMPDERLPPVVDGTFSPDIMRNFDVELDFPKGKLNLISPDHCPGNVVYWTHDAYATVPLKLDRFAHMSLRVSLDGKAFNADLDTGASRSVLSFEAAKSLFGWSDNDPKLTAHKNADGKPVTYTYPFESMSFEGVMVNHPDIVIVPDAGRGWGSNGPDLIIGMGVIRQLHPYIAYKENKLYVTAVNAH